MKRALRETLAQLEVTMLEVMTQMAIRQEELRTLQEDLPRRRLVKGTNLVTWAANRLTKPERLPRSCWNPRFSMENILIGKAIW